MESLWVAVPEPHLETHLRDALSRSLAELSADGATAPRRFAVQVEQADWRPLMRGTSIADYEAALRILVEAEGPIRSFSARSMVVGRHSAAEEKRAREATFAALSDRLAAEVALWLSGLP